MGDPGRGTRTYPGCFLEHTPYGRITFSALLWKKEAWSCFNLVCQIFLTSQWKRYPLCGVNGDLMGESGAGEVEGGELGFLRKMKKYVNK